MGRFLSIFPPHVPGRLNIHLEFDAIGRDAGFLDQRSEDLDLLLFGKSAMRSRQKADCLNEFGAGVLLAMTLNSALQLGSVLR